MRTHASDHDFLSKPGELALKVAQFLLHVDERASGSFDISLYDLQPSVWWSLDTTPEGSDADEHGQDYE